MWYLFDPTSSGWCKTDVDSMNFASNWLKRLPAGSISTWEDLTTCFLAQFFPPGRTAKLRNDILMFQQHQRESLPEAWTRFKDLLQKVPHYGIDLWLQGASCTQGTVSSIPIVGSISQKCFLSLILLLVVIIATVVVTVVVVVAIVGVVIVVAVIGVVLIVGGVSFIIKLSFMFLATQGVFLGSRVGIVYIHIDAACASSVAATQIDTEIIERVIQYEALEFLVDLTGDEDLTDEDGDTGMGDSTGVSVSLGGGISLGGKKFWELSIGDSGNIGDGGKIGGGSIETYGGIVPGEIGVSSFGKFREKHPQYRNRMVEERHHSF
ncbi:zinc finger, CCHC-type containing protein [Tanacetum coccineum]